MDGVDFIGFTESKISTPKLDFKKAYDSKIEIRAPARNEYLGLYIYIQFFNRI